MADVVFVLNPQDRVMLTRRLAALAGPGRLIVRPTPGGATGDLVLDVLAAAGTSPGHALEEKLAVAAAWKVAAAWLTGDQITIVVVDRAHLLRMPAIDRLAELAAATGATLYLIWSAEPDQRLKDAENRFEHSERLELEDFPDRLPLPLPAAVDQPPAKRYPTDLPLVDFPLFLATARRRLTPEHFAHVREQFDRERATALAWIENNLGYVHRTMADRVIHYLRDERIGPAESGPTALIRLRATQAAFLISGMALRWQPATLGPDPAGRLTTMLSDKIARALRTGVSPESAAATALSLYFCTGPENFGLIRCRHLSPDGHTLHIPPPRDLSTYDTGQHYWTRAPWRDDHNNFEAIDIAKTRHLVTTTPIQVPAAAAPLLAAHLAHRRAAGAGDEDPYFLRSSGGVPRDPERLLREAILRACHRINLAPAWLHRSHCRHGDQVGRHVGPDDWLKARALTFNHARYQPTETT